MGWWLVAGKKKTCVWSTNYQYELNRGINDVEVDDANKSKPKLRLVYTRTKLEKLSIDQPCGISYKRSSSFRCLIKDQKKSLFLFAKPQTISSTISSFFLRYTANALAAQEKVLEIASRLGVRITVGVAHQFQAGLSSNLRNVNDGISMYLGAAPIVECLEKYNPNVIITSRVTDAALFLAPTVYELGWN
ncbi:hypothetical protein SSX86_021738 [Deinandra increscens subsp. villosa]|uniref:Acyclic terpene utilisation N-terminal domain-containing protein n=1 Tax=Deinandra increscens subsp. villosa TaxID=3103831 RepID=A0AAP0CLV7_9ASTR